jgi:hypothetical protein
MKWQPLPKSSGPGRFAWVVFFIPLAGWLLPDEILLKALDFFEFLSLPLPNAHAIWGYERAYDAIWKKPFPTRTHFLLIGIGHFLILWCFLLVVRLVAPILSSQLQRPPSVKLNPGWWILFVLFFTVVVAGFFLAPQKPVSKFNPPINSWLGELIYSGFAWVLATLLANLEQFATSKILATKEARRSQ